MQPIDGHVQKPDRDGRSVASINEHAQSLSGSSEAIAFTRQRAIGMQYLIAATLTGHVDQPFALRDVMLDFQGILSSQCPIKGIFWTLIITPAARRCENVFQRATISGQ
jgi:hypothetical protein